MPSTDFSPAVEGLYLS